VLTNLKIIPQQSSTQISFARTVRPLHRSPHLRRI